MKRLFLIILIGFLFTSCRSWILENRTNCPSFLFFDIENAESFKEYDRIHICAHDNVTDVLLASDTTVIRTVQSKEFYLAVKKSEAAKGFGVLGFDKCKIVNSSDWVVEPGEEYDPIFHFDYTVPARDESVIVPVELVKDHSRVHVKFVNFDSFTSADGAFPFYIVVKSNTCGLDALTGVPVKGEFMFQPEEFVAGEFKFILPRQADRSLSLELWAEPGKYVDEGLIREFNLWGMLNEQADISWDAKNLPDIYLEIDYIESKFDVTVSDWDERLDFEFEI